MKESFSMNEVIRGTFCRNWQIQTFEPEKRNQMFEAMRDLVAGHSRGKRRQRILNTPLGALTEKGIFGRLRCDENGNAFYIAGQDYIVEMGILRDIFD